jgi:hypothetical protein
MSQLGIYRSLPDPRLPGGSPGTFYRLFRRRLLIRFPVVVSLAVSAGGIETGVTLRYPDRHLSRSELPALEGYILPALPGLPAEYRVGQR